MIESVFFRLSAGLALAAAISAPARAQGVPLPSPRPAHLAVQAPPVMAPAVPAAPVQTLAPVRDTAAAPAAAPVASPAPPASPAQIPQVAAAPAASPVPAAPAPAPLALGTPPAPVSAPGAQVAAADPAAAMTEADREAQTLAKVNRYFNGIRTLVGNFTQVGPDGSRADGKFFLAKPGKVRFYYQRPSTTDIIADGRSLVVRDRKLATQDVYPLSQTPLKFLLDTKLDLARDSKVQQVYEEPGLISVAIEEETTFGGKARILLVFATQDQTNFELKQWTITDAQGLDTTIAVSELDTSTKPDEKLFKVDYTIDRVR